jgi:hypothetical protein
MTDHKRIENTIPYAEIYKTTKPLNQEKNMEIIRYVGRKKGIPVYQPKSIEELIQFGIENWKWIEGKELRESVLDDINSEESDAIEYKVNGRDIVLVDFSLLSEE